ncbi:MAG: YdeI/OmpD-associated family protein [Planctomycetales bacterium]|nr:YdeI/OmpD-associated family protein [Planctomycetales bacterium]
MNRDVERYLRETPRWRKELDELRRIVLDSPLSETMKWRAPCYTFEGRNVVMLGALKDSCTLSFFQGALLSDPHGILEKPGANTRAARRVRFTSVRAIEASESELKNLIQRAIELEKSGAKVDFATDREPELPPELLEQFAARPALQAAFESLTPGRQRAYAIFFAGAKQSQTRVSRIEKYTAQILDGKGLNDCTCGLSRKIPACDGSHKSNR